MNARDPRVDAYITKSASFAIPILTYLRELVHEACPEVAETIKWSMPNFEYKGRVMCSIAAFKQHCALNLWFAPMLSDPEKLLLVGDEKSSMGNLGRISSLDDLPDQEILLRYLKESAACIDAGIKKDTVRKPPVRTEPVVSDYFKENLETNEAALATFNRFTPSQKKEYLDWIADAKTEATRDKRMANALEWMAEGKIRNWKYLK